MTHHLNEQTYSDLLNELTGAFMAAATGAGDLRGQLAYALATAGVVPESCREDDIRHRVAMIEGKEAA